MIAHSFAVPLLFLCADRTLEHEKAADCGIKTIQYIRTERNYLPGERALSKAKTWRLASQTQSIAAIDFPAARGHSTHTRLKSLYLMSLTLRALVAILLMIGFYVLALGVSAALLWLVYMQWTSSESGAINLRLAFFCVGGAGVILWSIVPRIDRFNAPGPRIDAKQQPQLFAELSNIA